MPERSIGQLGSERARCAGGGANELTVNYPDGYPSDFPPISWLSTGDPSGPGSWWYGSDSGGGLVPIGPNGPWANGQGAANPVVIRATSLITGPLSAAPYRVLSETTAGQPSLVPR